MQLTPLIAVHMTAAIAAIAVGPVALWARKGATQRPRLHRAFGYAWVTLMLVAAATAIFIRDFRLPNIAGYTPIHLIVPVTFYSLFRAFQSLVQGNIAGHRKAMQSLYVSACLVAGAFTLLPGRYLGNLVFGHWLGVISTNYQPTQGTPMIAQILINTPVWVWGLLAALLVLGYSQTRSRTVGLARVALLPVGMGALSFYSNISTFGASPIVLGIWLTTSASLALVISPIPADVGACYDSASRQFHVPGSWVPMVLIIGIFLTKYAVGVSLALHPTLKSHANFSLAAISLYGVFSGIFIGRAVQLIRLALRRNTNRIQPALTT